MTASTKRTTRFFLIFEGVALLRMIVVALIVASLPSLVLVIIVAFPCLSLALQSLEVRTPEPRKNQSGAGERL